MHSTVRRTILSRNLLLPPRVRLLALLEASFSSSRLRVHANFAIAAARDVRLHTFLPALYKK
jgi:hypothetical protein